MLEHSLSNTVLEQVSEQAMKGWKKLAVSRFGFEESKTDSYQGEPGSLDALKLQVALGG